MNIEDGISHLPADPGLAQSIVDAFGWPAVFLVLFFIYFVPAYVARSRNMKAMNGVFMTNLLFGWTFIGWAVAMVWSVTGEPKGEGVSALDESAKDALLEKLLAEKAEKLEQSLVEKAE